MKIIKVTARGNVSHQLFLVMKIEEVMGGTDYVNMMRQSVLKSQTLFPLGRIGSGSWINMAAISLVAEGTDNSKTFEI